MIALSPWRVVSSEHVRADRWISLRADHCVTSDGIEVGPYYVLEYPDWVHVVAISARQEVLFVEQYRHAFAGVTLEIPAGRMDPADASPEETGRRELREETGAAAAECVWLSDSSPNPASHTNRVHTILATGVEIVTAPRDDPHERLRASWMSPEAAFKVAMGGQLPAMQAASLLSAFATLGWLRFDAEPTTDALNR